MTNLENDCRKYLGLKPYAGWTNISVGDPFFYQQICTNYGETAVKQMIDSLNWRNQ